MDRDGDAWFRPKGAKSDFLDHLPLPQKPLTSDRELWLDPETIARLMELKVVVGKDGARITTRWAGRYNARLAKPFDLAPTSDIQVEAPEIQKLAKRVTSKARTAPTKAKAIHDWVTENIRYDYAGLAHPTRAVLNAVGVLSQRSGIGEGYSNLAAALFRASGLPARVVHGWVRHPEETWLDILKKNPNDRKHAWNEVLVDSRWVSIDVTWDAGFDDRGRQIRPGVRYFDPPAERFANDHLRVLPPSVTPTFPLWFRLGEEHAREVRDRALHDLQTHVGKYRSTCVVLTGGPVGHFEEGRAQALLIGTRSDCTQSGSLLMRFELHENSWELVDSKEVTVKEELPTGAWPAPEWLPSGGIVRARSRTAAFE